MSRILILAPTPVARAGLRALLLAEPGGELSVVAEATGSADLAAQVVATEPDCLLLDPEPTDEHLLVVVGQLISERPGLPVIMLGPATGSTVREALAAGARAILRLAATGPELVASIRAALLGLVVLDPAVAGPLLDQITDQQARLLPPTAPLPALTQRETEVLQLLARGHTNRGIAAELGISEHTAKFHVGALLSKLGAGSRAEAVALAARQGLILV